MHDDPNGVGDLLFAGPFGHVVEESFNAVVALAQGGLHRIPFFRRYRARLSPDLAPVLSFFLLGTISFFLLGTG